jgi:hypothetical protein
MSLQTDGNLSNDVRAQTKAQRPLHESLLNVISDLKNHLTVLEILDGSAVEWPGIVACTDSMQSLARAASARLVEAERTIKEMSGRVTNLTKDVALQRLRADKAEEQLKASREECHALSKSVVKGEIELSRERRERDQQVCVSAIMAERHLLLSLF